MPIDAVLEAIYSAIDQINRELPKNKQLKKSEETVLYGKLGKLDSLSFVGLVVATEANIEAKLKVSVTLANTLAFTQKNSPFKTVRSLAAHARALIDEKKKAE